MTQLSFPGLGARLVHVGSAEPRARCPVCDAARVPPESDDGIPPPHQWNYVCGAGYWAEDEELLAGWVPYLPCYRVSTEQALAWIRESNTDERLAPLLSQVTSRPPFSGGALFVSLPRLKATAAPPSCPCCMRPASAQLSFTTQYACNASYGVASTAPNAAGLQEATSFVGQSDCEQPPLGVVLRTLAERRDAHEPLCEELCAILSGA